MQDANITGEEMLFSKHERIQKSCDHDHGAHPAIKKAVMPKINIQSQRLTAND